MLCRALPGLSPRAKSTQGRIPTVRQCVGIPYGSSINDALLFPLKFLELLQMVAKHLLAQGTLQIPMKHRTLLLRPW